MAKLTKLFNKKHLIMSNLIYTNHFTYVIVINGKKNQYCYKYIKLIYQTL